MELTIEVPDNIVQSISRGLSAKEFTLSLGQIAAEALRKAVPPPLREGERVRWGRSGGRIEAIRGNTAWVVDTGRDDFPGILINLDILQRAD